MILLDPLARPVIGHRGNRAHAPENTIPSLLEAVALGVDAVEFDVHATRDGHVVLLHDPTLDRTTSSQGAVHLRTLAELREVDAGYWFTSDGGRSYPWRGRGAHVPSFDEVIEALPATLPIIVELKTPRATEALRSAIARHGLSSRLIVAGFSDVAVKPLRGGSVAMGASMRELARCLPSVYLRRSIVPPFRAACIPPSHRGFRVPIEGFVRSFRGSGAVTHVWTINDPSRARELWACGVNGIISDDPAVMLAERAREIAQRDR